jgi:hypothetical protein
VLPDSLEHIGTAAFEGCRGLSALALPKVTTIDARAFRGCTGLTALALSNTLRFIGWKAFENCVGLTELALPASLEDIAYNAFSGCTGLTALHLPRSIRVAELVLALGEKPQLTVEGVPCSPEDVLQRIREAQA